MMIPRTRPDLGALEILSALCPGATRREFEEEVAIRAGAQYGLAFAYAHAGFFALLRALNLTQAEVILPAYTCKIMPEVVMATGNIPVFADIDLADYNMDLGALKSAITTKTRVIVATHMFGYPINVDAIREITNNGHIVIVEDAALMFPDSVHDLGGLRGDVGLFSFGPGKPLFTIRGGVMITSDATLHERLRSYRDEQMGCLPSRECIKRWILLMAHYLLSRKLVYGATQPLGLSRNALHVLASRLRLSRKGGRSSTALIPNDFSTRYTDFQARLGLVQLRKAGSIRSWRQTLARLYGEALHGVSGLTPAPVVDGASYSLYPIRVENRDAIDFIQKMRAKGIETGRVFNALSNLIRFRPYARDFYPCAEQAGREAVSLPAHTDLTEKQTRYIAESIRQVLANT